MACRMRCLVCDVTPASSRFVNYLDPGCALCNTSVHASLSQLVLCGGDLQLPLGHLDCPFSALLLPASRIA